MAKKVVATLQTGDKERFAKVIFPVVSPKGSIAFKKRIIPAKDMSAVAKYVEEQGL